AILFWKVGLDVQTQLFNNISLALYVILIVWIVFFLLISYLILRIQSDLKLVTTFMNITSIILFLLIIFQHSTKLEYTISNLSSEKIALVNSDEILKANLTESAYPDIYFIVLDGYGRDDSLSGYFDYDNQQLLTYLSDKGFHISTESNSNYLLTYLSLATTLNMDYLDDLAAEMGTTNNNIFPVLQRIQNNRLMDFLVSLGYRTIAFQSGYHATEMGQVDHYYSGASFLTEYEHVIINLTPLQIWLNNYQYETHRKRIHYTFDQLPDVIQSDKPTFVFAHILAPHDPFIFGPNGEKHNPEETYSLFEENPPDLETGRGGYITDYTNQVTYINSLVRDTVDKILSKPGRTPIIIIQGDHGPRPIWYWNSLENSDLPTIFPILNAIYFPDQDYSNLYPGISSVNTFRLILDQYFGTQLGLVEDKSYFSMMRGPYDYIDITDQIENP
ncbi:MAG: sulfatase-like hydrolase/transferase, partial [Candidatus Kariarchaeaceae archaeon]